MRHPITTVFWLVPALIAILGTSTGARAEAPHSTTIPPGGNTAETPSQNTTVNAAENYSAMEPGEAPAVEVDNQPPRFLYSDSPAVLIPVDGSPVLHDSSAADLDRVINSRAPLFRSRRDGRYHLALGNQWYASKTLEGVWSPEGPSSALAARLAQARTSAGAEVDEITPPSANARVFVSSEPAELIQTSGNAALTPIGNGHLLYVTNTPNDLFFSTPDQRYYLLASGRWYRSSYLAGTWAYVDARTLPPEFGQIPPGHPKAGVLASVPGTGAAAAAVANASVPQVATVDRAIAANNVRYDGSPEFAPIPGTALEYARNSSEPVIEVSPGRYMAVENGVWFEGPTAEGPWSVATSVPPAIYGIPPSSPVYYVRYVYVYGYGTNWVRVGYLPGYFGSYVTPEGVVVYGTGYHYRPWIGHVWYGYPVTYGFGVSWGIGSTWVFGGAAYHPYRPYWGPWRWERYHHAGPAPGPVYVARHDFYHAWGHHVTPYARPPLPRSPGTTPGGWSHTPPPTHATNGGWSHYAPPAPTRSAPPRGFTRIPHLAAPAPYHGPSPSPFAHQAQPFRAPTPAPLAPHYASAAPASGRGRNFTPPRDFRPHADSRLIPPRANSDHARR